MDRKKRRDNTSFSSYIYKVLKQVHSTLSISAKAMFVMDDFLSDLFNLIVTNANELLEMNHSMTLTAREIQTAVRLSINGELAKHSIAEGIKAVVKFGSHVRGNNNDHDGAQMERMKGREGKSKKAGILFPVGRIHRFLRTKLRLRIGTNAAVYLAAVLEYMCAELLELAGNCARDYGSKRITPRDICLAVRGDEELDHLLSKTVIVGGGVLPHIHRALVSKKGFKKMVFENQSPVKKDCNI